MSPFFRGFPGEDEHEGDGLNEVGIGAALVIAVAF